jgi:hypothetical protein
MKIFLYLFEYLFYRLLRDLDRVRRSFDRDELFDPERE